MKYKLDDSIYAELEVAKARSARNTVCADPGSFVVDFWSLGRNHTVRSSVTVDVTVYNESEFF